jgi:hypothetical protein
MKRFASILSIIGMICLSQSSIAQTGSASLTQLTSTKPSVVRVAKPKLFRSNPYRYHRIYVENNDEVTVDDEDLMSPYRREDLFKLVDIEEDLPDYILNKLAAARKRAVELHTQKWA